MNTLEEQALEDTEDEQMKELLKMIAEISGKQSQSFAEPSLQQQLLSQTQLGEISPEERELMEKLSYLDNIDKGGTAVGTAAGAALGGVIGGAALPGVGAIPGAAIGSALGGVAGQLGGKVLEDLFSGNDKERLADLTSKRNKKELERLEKLAKEEEEARQKTQLLNLFFSRYL